MDASAPSKDLNNAEKRYFDGLKLRAPSHVNDRTEFLKEHELFLAELANADSIRDGKLPVNKKGRAAKQFIKNIVTNLSCNGGLYDQLRATLTKIIDAAPYEHLLLRIASPRNMSFKGLYAISPDLSMGVRVYGQGPKELCSDDIKAYFKYDSGSKSLKELPVKSFGISVHAIALDKKV